MNRVSRQLSKKKLLPKEGIRVLILVGEHAGAEGVCLGSGNEANKWAVSPDADNSILQLVFETEFGLLFKIPDSPQN